MNKQILSKWNQKKEAIFIADKIDFKSKATTLGHSGGRKGWGAWRDKEGHCIKSAAAAAAKSLQSCPTLCDPIDGSLPGSPIPGIPQATTLEWVAISFSNAWKWKVKVKSFCRVLLLATPWTVA